MTSLFAKYGFRVVDYTVDADTSFATHLLAVFRCDRPERGHYEFFVLLDDKAPEGVSVSEKQLCVDGAKHGVRHAVTVRPGLPSIYSEMLEKPVTVSVYVRDRQPSVRFTGRNFVLPRGGRQAIPLSFPSILKRPSSISIASMRAASARSCRGRDFLSQLSGYDAENLAEDRGEKLWSGSVASRKEAE